MIFARANLVSVHHLKRRKARFLIASAFRLNVPKAELDESGGLWRVGKSREAFVLKWQGGGSVSVPALRAREV